MLQVLSVHGTKALHFCDCTCDITIGLGNANFFFFAMNVSVGDSRRGRHFLYSSRSFCPGYEFKFT